MLRSAALSLVLCSLSAAAQAGVIDLGTAMGNANIFTLGDFNSWSSDVEGAIVSGGSINVSGYSVNLNNVDAFGSQGYAAVARNNINLSNGQINNGMIYAGGTVSLASSNKPVVSTTKPIDFDAAAAYFTTLSTDLSTLSASGSIEQKPWGETILTGGAGVSVFNFSGDVFKRSNNWKLNGLTAGQTIILNVSGTAAGANPNGVSFDAFSKYNVLYNFYEATTLDPRGMFGSVLAPQAAVNASWGVVNGSVIVGSWNSPTQINSNHYFSPIELAGFRDPLPPVVVVPETPVPGKVPEPGSLGLAMAALGMAAFARKRRA